MSGHTPSPEAHRICNVVPTQPEDMQKDWLIGHALSSGAITAPPALPPSVDLRAAWWAIGDQENTGSCVGWGSTDGVARYQLVKAGKIPQSQLLSPRYTWMASKEADSSKPHPITMIEEAGTSLRGAVNILKNYGAATAQQLSFEINKLMYTGDENSFYASLSQRKISAYFNMLKDINQWRNWLASHGPILAGLSVDRSWDNATATHGLIDHFQPNTVRGGHAIAVVGYRADGTFIVRNSWGVTWGDHGFGYVTQAYIAAAFFAESYGVTV